jgi:hypothetical protein
LGIDPPTIFVHDLDTLALFVGLDFHHHVAILTFATGLADELSFAISRAQ